MSDPGSAAGDEAMDLDAELAAIAEGARALLEWLEASGADGLPAEPSQGSSTSNEVDEPTAVRTPTEASRSRQPSPRATSIEEQGDSADRSGRGARGPAENARPTEPHAPPRRRPPTTTREQEIARQEALARLAVLEHEVRSCTRCPLHEGRKHTVFARGNPQARLAFVGEGPGAEEDKQGIPFVGAAGQLLDRMITAMGFDPADVYICNIVKCRPPGNRKPEPAEMQCCAPYLREQLELVDPEVIVALGATAVQGLLEWYDVGQYGPGITRLRGNWKLYQGRVPFMPTFHPAYLLRTPAKKRDVWTDLQAVMVKLAAAKPRAGGGAPGSS